MASYLFEFGLNQRRTARPKRRMGIAHWNDRINQHRIEKIDIIAMPTSVRRIHLSLRHHLLSPCVYSNYDSYFVKI